MSQRSVLIIGGGLIGTSIALGLKQAGWAVAIEDIDPINEKLARDLLGEREIGDQFELIVIATPPEAIASELQRFATNNPHSTFMDISGLKFELIAKVETFSDLAKRFVGSHPMAGRENSGPQSARGDLFEGRAWIVTPTSRSSSNSLEIVNELISDLGATSYLMSSTEHDAVISRISHLPQIMSSLLAASLVSGDSESLSLSGQGLRDVTRLAASDPRLWTELTLGNRRENIAQLNAIQILISELIAALQSQSAEEVQEFFRLGNQGKKLIPGKHGAKERDYTYLPIVIDDKPGQLARIFHECEVVNVNVEDLTIEHTPGQETGLITLALSAFDAEKLQSHLNANGWLAHSPRKN